MTRISNSYLNITGLEVSRLLNFKQATLTWKRVVTGDNEKKLTTDNPDGTDTGK